MVQYASKWSRAGWWDTFKDHACREFASQDSFRRACDKLRHIMQITNEAAYLIEFRNLVSAIPEMTQVEKVEKFAALLKPQVRMELMKTGPIELDAAGHVAPNVDSAIFAAGRFMRYGGDASYSVDRPHPMHIGTVEGQ